MRWLFMNACRQYWGLSSDYAVLCTGCQDPGHQEGSLNRLCLTWGPAYFARRAKVDIKTWFTCKMTSPACRMTGQPGYIASGIVHIGWLNHPCKLVSVPYIRNSMIFDHEPLCMRLGSKSRRTLFSVQWRSESAIFCQETPSRQPAMCKLQVSVEDGVAMRQC